MKLFMFCPICNMQTEHTQKKQECVRCRRIENNYKFNCFKYCPVCQQETDFSPTTNKCRRCYRREYVKIHGKEHYLKNKQNQTTAYCAICHKVTPHSKRKNECWACKHRIYRQTHQEQIQVRNQQNKNMSFCVTCNKVTPHSKIKNECQPCKKKTRTINTKNMLFCPVCQKQTVHTKKTNECRNCYKKQHHNLVKYNMLQNKQYCTVCKRDTPHDNHNTCVYCHTKILKQKREKTNIRFCDVCQQNTPHTKKGSCARCMKRNNRNKEQAKIIKLLRERLRIFLKLNGIDKNGHIGDMVGCSAKELVIYLQGTLYNRHDGTPMTLNHPDVHIDHIIPISYAKTFQDAYRLNHYTNLQLLWKEDNSEKSNNIDWVHPVRGKRVSRSGIKELLTVDANMFNCDTYEEENYMIPNKTTIIQDYMFY